MLDGLISLHKRNTPTVRQPVIGKKEGVEERAVPMDDAPVRMEIQQTAQHLDADLSDQ